MRNDYQFVHAHIYLSFFLHAVYVSHSSLNVQDDILLEYSKRHFAWCEAWFLSECFGFIVQGWTVRDFCAGSEIESLITSRHLLLLDQWAH